MKIRRLLLALCVGTLLYPTAAGIAAPQHRYLEPVKTRGMTFPLLRSNWYSVINFRDDWHAPRMRFIDGRWRQVGIHEGNDVFAEPGTPVVAIAPGRIERVGWTF
jgi:murein DD-endopeptidase MepM/ murein hydrolase activator NlpD